MVVLTALAMAGAGATTLVVESRRIEQRTLNAVNDELAEFETLRSVDVDPQTGERFVSFPRLSKVALKRNSPDEHEILIGWWRDAPRLFQPSGSTGEEMAVDPDFRGAVRDLLATGGGSTEIMTSLGDTQVTVQPVPGDGRGGAFVIAYLTGAARADFYQTMRVYGAVALVALFAVTFGAWSVSGRLLRPVRRLRTTAEEITDTDLSRRIPVEGTDDISDLVRTVNAMLGRLEKAFSTQRTFLDDAGHELRTPVTVIRGHLELVDPFDHADVSATRQLLLDEVDRMSRLVDDLIVLAKADRPDFLRPVPTDVGALTDQVLEKARGTAGREWRVDERAETKVVFDPQRITQALLQLVANAVRHTSDGGSISLGSRLDAGRLRFWVRDDGPGVLFEDRERIFARFHRGSGQTTEGSGLGLSIVRAIAEAHGGSAHVDSPPGQGATFVLTLPAVSLSGATSEEPLR